MLRKELADKRKRAGLEEELPAAQSAEGDDSSDSSENPTAEKKISK